MIKYLVFFVEGKSEAALLQGLVPLLLTQAKASDVTPKYIQFDGKEDLEGSLRNKLRGWKAPNTNFVILIDQDNDDCKELKARLAKICKEAGKPAAIVRIACQELESWYLGDLEAVEKGLALPNGKLRNYSDSRKYQQPDTIQKPSKELQSITGQQYRKGIGCSRAIGPHLKTAPNQNRSESFNCFLTGIQKALTPWSA